MFRKLHEKRKNEEGFTLIELLVVILIIAILAAIAIPVFLRQREKGWVSQMESALKNGATAAESYATGRAEGNYTGISESVLQSEGWKRASSVTISDISATTNGNDYCIAVNHGQLDDAAIEPMAISSVNTAPTRNRNCANGVMTTG